MGEEQCKMNESCRECSKETACSPEEQERHEQSRLARKLDHIRTKRSDCWTPIFTALTSPACAV